jgi:hypothetical protein
MVLRVSLSSLTTTVAPINRVIRLSTVAKSPAAGARAFSIIAWMARALSTPTTPWMSVTSLPWAASCPNTRAATAMTMTRRAAMEKIVS